MPFDKLGHSTAKGPATWPGQVAMGNKNLPKFGSVQPAPRSAPQRALDAIRHQLQKMGLVKREPMRTGPAPLPRYTPPVAPFSKLLGNAVNTLADARAASDNDGFNAAAVTLGEQIDDVLGRLRDGRITGWLDRAMTEALASGDTQAFAAALTKRLLEGLPPGTPGRFDGGWLDAAVLSAVENNVRDHGALTKVPPPPSPTTPPALLGPDREPLVRLQALAASADEMAPVLATLDGVADALSTGDTARVERHLSDLSAQLGLLLGRHDKAVKVAFAQSDGQAFIQDLKQAILARTPEDSRHAVSLELEHFKGPYLKAAFDDLVGGMLAAAPDVQRAAFKLPMDANAGVIALRGVAQAMLALQGAANGTEDEQLEASFGLRRAMGDFLGLVARGSLAPGLAQTFHDAVVGDDVAAFVDVMSRKLLDTVPADQHDQIQALLDTHLAPLVQEHVAQHGPLTLQPQPTPALQPKTHFDAPLLPTARLGQLQGPYAQTQSALQAMARVAHALASDKPEAVQHQLGQLVGQLKPLLLAQPESTRLAFTLSQGDAFVDDLAAAIVEQAPEGDRDHVAAQLQLFMRPLLQKAFEQLASGVLDQASPTASPASPPATLTVGDRTYTLVRTEQDEGDVPKGSPKKLGSGKFGVVYKYENLAVKGRTDDLNRPLKDEVALKIPLLGGVDARSPLARELLLLDPLREGQASALVMGSGGGTAHTAQLVGAVRTDERVMLIYRFEEGGELKKKVDVLNAAHTDEKLARGKLGLMLDLVGALRRLHEVKGVMHRDIALRNVLLDDKGRAVLSDFGMAWALAENSAIDGASIDPGRDGPLPLRWTAPEVRKGQPVTQKAEVFSLGVAFIELAWGLGDRMVPWSMEGNDTFKSGGPPWDAQAMMDKMGDIPAHLWPGVDRAQLKQLITRMVDADPAKRPTLAEVAASPVLQGVLPEHRKALQAVLAPKKADGGDGVVAVAPSSVPSVPASPPVAVAPAPALIQPPLRGAGDSLEYEAV